MFNRVCLDVLSCYQELCQAIKPTKIVVPCSWRTLTIKENPINKVCTKHDIKLVSVLYWICLDCNEILQYVHFGGIVLACSFSVHAVNIFRITFQAIFKENKSTAFVISQLRIPTLAKQLCQNFHYFSSSVFFRRDTEIVCDIISFASH